MTTITHTPDGPRFDGMKVAEIIQACEQNSDRLDFLPAAAAALRHLSGLATPDPERVTGRLRWEDGDAYLGRVRIGTINALTSKPLKYGVDTRWVTVPGYFGTEASARTALVAAVKEAIGDE